MNEKASEAIARGEAEPERALEYLKQAESFLKKIEKSRKNNIKTEVNQSGDSSFLNGRIEDQEKSVRISRNSEPVLDDDGEIAGHTIYRTNTA
jgi:ssDNA-binding replication factor A large subunit